MLSWLCRARLLLALVALTAAPIVALPWGLLSRSIVAQQQEEDDDDADGDGAKEKAAIYEAWTGKGGGRGRNPRAVDHSARRPSNPPRTLHAQKVPAATVLPSAPMSSRVRLQI